MDSQGDIVEAVGIIIGSSAATVYGWSIINVRQLNFVNVAKQSPDDHRAKANG